MIQLDRSNPAFHRAVLVGPLDNRTADGFDEWLRKYTDHFKPTGKLYIDMAKLDVLSSRAISSLIFYFEQFKTGGGQLRLLNVPPMALVSLDKLGFTQIGLIHEGAPA